MLPPPKCLTSKDMLSNRGHDEALCLMLREEVLRELVCQTALRPPVYHSDSLIQPNYMASQRECGFMSWPHELSSNSSNETIKTLNELKLISKLITREWKGGRKKKKKEQHVKLLTLTGAEFCSKTVGGWLSPPFRSLQTSLETATQFWGGGGGLVKWNYARTAWWVWFKESKTDNSWWRGQAKVSYWEPSVMCQHTPFFPPLHSLKALVAKSFVLACNYARVRLQTLDPHCNTIAL